MPKNTLIPQEYAGLAPPIPEQSIVFDQGRQTVLRGYSPADSLGSDVWSVSWWMKAVGKQGVSQTIFEARIDANNYTRFWMDLSLPLGKFKFEAFIGGALRAGFKVSQAFWPGGPAWAHFLITFNRTTNSVTLHVNGIPWQDPLWRQTPFADNVGGYAWLNSGADHSVGARQDNTENFNGLIADFHCVAGAQELPTQFGQFVTPGVWQYKSFAGPWGSQGFNLTFGRTADLGEDFSGNSNDFTNHVNAAPAGGDQYDDWPERNYCVLDPTDGVGNQGLGISNGGLTLDNPGNGKISMRPAANTGVWFWEENGVPVTWDTGVSGRVDPTFLSGRDLNFGQRPFVVGPGVGEQLLISLNLPAAEVVEPREALGAVSWLGDNVSPRVITGGFDIWNSEHDTLVNRTDMIFTTIGNVGLVPPGGLRDKYLAHRLLPPATQVRLSNAAGSAWETVNANGVITDLLDPGFEITIGGTDFSNFNLDPPLFGTPRTNYQATTFTIQRYAQTQRTLLADDDAEEIQPFPGTVDNGSSDLELNSESDSAASEQFVGMRFPNMLVDQGATVTEAFLQFEADETRTGVQSDVRIWMEDIDNAPAFVEVVGNISTRTRTTNFTDWVNIPGWTIQDRLDAQKSPDIASAVEEVAARVGWTPGNAMVSIVGHLPGSPNYERRTAECANSGTPAGANQPHLSVVWNLGFPNGDNGMSLFRYQGIGQTKSQKIAHGLGGVPDFFFIKSQSASEYRVYHSLIQTGLASPELGHLVLNTDVAAVTSAGSWNDTAPDADLITLGTDADVNTDGTEYIGFAMREVEGFSKVFRYVGGGGTVGPFIYTGFSAKVVLIKATNVAARNWLYHSAAELGPSTRDGFIDNSAEFNLWQRPSNLNQTENASGNANLLVASNGILIRDSDVRINELNTEYVGIAFAEVPINIAKEPL